MGKMTPKEAVRKPVKFIEEIISEVKNKDRGYTPTVIRTTVPGYGNGRKAYEGIDREDEEIRKNQKKNLEHRRAQLQDKLYGRGKRGD